MTKGAPILVAEPLAARDATSRTGKWSRYFARKNGAVGNFKTSGRIPKTMSLQCGFIYGQYTGDITSACN